MKKLAYICLFTVLVSGCDQKNPGPRDPSALLAQAQAVRNSQNAQSAIPATTTNRSPQHQNEQLNLVTCTECREKCMDSDSKWAADKDSICKTCKDQIVGCSEDYSQTYYHSDLAGLSQQDVQRFDAYPNFHLFNGTSGAAGFGPWAGPNAGGYQFQSQYFRQNAGHMNRVPCGRFGFRKNCKETIYSEQHRRCKKIRNKLDEAAARLEKGEAPEKVYLELVRIQPEVERVSGRSRAGSKFSDILQSLKNAGKSILGGIGGAVTSTATSIATGIENRADAMASQAGYNVMGNLQGMAQGFDYLAYQDPNDPCQPVECEEEDLECIEKITVTYEEICK